MDGAVPDPRQEWTAETINALPIRRFEGSVYLVHSDAQVGTAAERLGRERVLGFDTETKPSFAKGQVNPPAILQLSSGTEAYLFQLLRLRRLGPVLALLSDPAVLKVGVAPGYDVRKLQEVYTFEPRGFVDLAALSSEAGVLANGLKGLAASLLGYRVSKRAKMSDWSRPELAPAQISYAATDAWVGREIFMALERLRHGA